ncbi:MAG: threonine synthase [Acholeplasmatales bacterium]|nr:threonine synthase [Acholeplasmatales bacterium]
MFHSTRGKELISSKEALIKGLAEDGGLFVPEEIKTLKLDNSDVNLTYQELATKIFKLYFVDFSDEEIKEIVSLYDTTNFPYKELKVRGTTDFAFLELYKGPTFAFKDMALTVLPKFIEIAKRDLHDNRKTVVLTATSGDTGSAALAGFSKNKNNKIIVLYPNGGTSEIQEKQMLSFESENAHALAVNGNFDDCQRIVKELFNEFKSDDIDLISANSINIGRLIPQIVYYFKGYLELVDKDYILFNEKINIVVPTGNFGNILASLIARKMGLPVNKIICASNENKVLTNFFKTGVYDSNLDFKKTYSPSMDILVSSNLERFIYYLYEDTDKVASLMNDLKETGKFSVDLDLLKTKFDYLLADYATNDETIDSIKEAYKHKILIDPHTAVAYKAYNNLYKELDNCFTLISSTASPYKFGQTICKAFNLNGENEKECIDSIYSYTGVKIDNRLYDSLFMNVNRTTVEKKEVKNRVLEIIKG